MSETVVVNAERKAWHCGACLISPLLAYYTHLGGVHVRVSGRAKHPTHYVYDLSRAQLDARCPVCGAWRRLSLDERQNTIIEGATPRPWPDVGEPQREQSDAELRIEEAQLSRRLASVRRRLVGTAAD